MYITCEEDEDGGGVKNGCGKKKRKQWPLKRLPKRKTGMGVSSRTNCRNRGSKVNTDYWA